MKKKKTEQSHRVLSFFFGDANEKKCFRRRSAKILSLPKHLALIDLWIHSELKSTRQTEGFLLLKAGHGAILTGKYISLV